MINKINISNFQSHKNTELELSSGINCITGSSDSGKSAILKALNWLINNKPQGIPFASDWILTDKGNMKKGEAVAVKILKEDIEILRQRMDSENSNAYAISGKGIFDAVRGDVPEEVQKVLNLSEVNIQTQFEKHFLLSESSGEVARFFNRIIKLDKIDSVLKNIESMKRKNNNNLIETEETVTKIIQDLEQYEWIEAAEKITEICIPLDTEIIELDKQINELNLKIDRYLEFKTNLKLYTRIINQSTDIIQDIEMFNNKIIEIDFEIRNLLIGTETYSRMTKILNESDKIIQSFDIVKEAEKLNKSVEELMKEIEDIETDIITYKRYKFVIDSSIDFKSVEELMKEIEETNISINDLSVSIRELYYINDSYSSMSLELKELNTEIKELQESMPAVCPLCNGTGKLKDC